MAKFVNENPSVFKQLGRFFKWKGKERAESSRRQPEHSPPEASERKSVSRQSRKEPNDQYEKRSSKVEGISKVLDDSICKKNDVHTLRRKAPIPATSNRASDVLFCKFKSSSRSFKLACPDLVSLSTALLLY